MTPSTNRFHLSIPQPCHERWANMSPTDKGAFCKACSKEVIDFSQQTTTQIVDFFTGYGGGGVCGRFRQSQLGTYTIEINPQLLQQRLPLWKKMLAVILLCFGGLLFSPAEGHAQGQPIKVLEWKKEAKVKKKAKKNHHRKKNRTITCWKEMGTDIYVGGIIGYDPRPKTSDNPMHVNFVRHEMPDILTYDTTKTHLDDGTVPKKENPPPPATDKEFFWAATATAPAATYRRRKRKRSS
jgi:hypothetical protein